MKGLPEKVESTKGVKAGCHQGLLQAHSPCPECPRPLAPLWPASIWSFRWRTMPPMLALAYQRLRPPRLLARRHNITQLAMQMENLY